MFHWLRRASLWLKQTLGAGWALVSGRGNSWTSDPTTGTPQTLASELKTFIQPLKPTKIKASPGWYPNRRQWREQEIEDEARARALILRMYD
jgi:hypothetical protein